MRETVRLIVDDYGWVHTSLGLLGNVLFFLGSIFFLPVLEPYKTAGAWLFIAGSFLMMVGAAGSVAVKLLEARGG